MIKLNTYIYEAWSGVKQQSLKQDIEAWCEEMGIKDYTINSKGEIDMDGSVSFTKRNIKELPYKFGKVNGFFSLTENPNLTSLKNCPYYVRGWFSCDDCASLDSLDGCPEEVGRDFWSSRCKKLTSLEGCPKKVGRRFYCSNCKKRFTKEEVMSLCEVKESNIRV